MAHRLTQASAATTFINSLPTVHPTDLRENSLSCPICRESFATSARSTHPAPFEAPLLLPCNHIMGDICLTTWFESHNTCPMCRVPLFNDPLRGFVSQLLTSPSPSHHNHNNGRWSDALHEVVDADERNADGLLVANRGMHERLRELRGRRDQDSEETRREIARIEGGLEGVDARLDEMMARADNLLGQVREARRERRRGGR